MKKYFIFFLSLAFILTGCAFFGYEKIENCKFYAAEIGNIDLNQDGYSIYKELTKRVLAAQISSNHKLSNEEQIKKIREIKSKAVNTSDWKIYTTYKEMRQCEGQLFENSSKKIRAAADKIQSFMEEKQEKRFYERYGTDAEICRLTDIVIKRNKPYKNCVYVYQNSGYLRVLKAVYNGYFVNQFTEYSYIDGTAIQIEHPNNSATIFVESIRDNEYVDDSSLNAGIFEYLGVYERIIGDYYFRLYNFKESPLDIYDIMFLLDSGKLSF